MYITVCFLIANGGQHEHLETVDELKVWILMQDDCKRKLHPSAHPADEIMQVLCRDPLSIANLVASTARVVPQKHTASVVSSELREATPKRLPINEQNLDDAGKAPDLAGHKRRVSFFFVEEPCEQVQRLMSCVCEHSQTYDPFHSDRKQVSGSLLGNWGAPALMHNANTSHDKRLIGQVPASSRLRRGIESVLCERQILKH